MWLGVWLLTTGCSLCCANTASGFQYCMVLSGLCRMSCLPGETYYSASYLCAGSSSGGKCCSAVRTTPPTCGARVTRTQSRVVHGREAARCEFPWLVYINLSDGGGNRCGGSVIDNKHILTAAHCFSSVADTLPEIVVGEYQRNESSRPGEKFSTTHYDVIIHPGFNRSLLVNDLAVLRLATPIDFSRFPCIRPLCLPTSQQHVFPSNTECLVAGWGQEGETTYDMPTVLQVAAVSVLEEERCAARYSDFDTSIQLCAGDLFSFQDSCFGDSGGPLMCPDSLDQQLYLAGIISYGDGCGRPGAVAVYTDVSALLPWVWDVVAARN